MLKSSLVIALVTLLTIHYVQSNVIETPLSAPVAAIGLAPAEGTGLASAAAANLAPVETLGLAPAEGTGLAPAAAIGLSSVNQAKLNIPFDLPLDVPKKFRKSKPTVCYPVDLIGKPKGCVLLEELEKDRPPMRWFEPNDKMTHQACWKICYEAGASFAAIAKGHECLCTNTTITSDTKLGTSDKYCKGTGGFQACGSATCAEYFILKINSDILRHSLRNLEAPNIWVHKRDWATWERYNEEVYEFRLREILPTSNAVINVYDCAAQTPVPDNCQNFYAVLTGFEDFLATPPVKESATVTPIDAEWDIVFSGQKGCKSREPDVLVFRRSLCEWVLKINEQIKEELSFLNFEFDNRALILVDKRNQDRTFRISDNHFRAFERGVQTRVFSGKWFNKVHHFKDYFRGTYECDKKITNPWYRPSSQPTVETSSTGDSDGSD